MTANNDLIWLSAIKNFSIIEPLLHQYWFKLEEEEWRIKKESLAS